MSSKNIQALLEPLVLEFGKHVKLPDKLPNLIETDSRTIQSGQWFLPIVGESFDGHDFIADSLNKGAAGFFYQKDRYKGDQDHLSHGIAVADTLRFLQSLGTAWRLEFQNLKLVAITGSSGKTTAKEMISQILNEKGNALATQGSLNNELGVPKTLCRLKPEHDYAIIEMGARHVGDIDFLLQMADPDVAVVLNIGNAHLGAFGSAEKLRQAKSEMIVNSSYNSAAIVPSLDKKLVKLAETHHQSLVTFGEGAHDHVRIAKTIVGKKGRMSVDLTIESNPVSIDFPVFHHAYPINIAASCAVAHALKLSPEEMKRGLEKYISIKGRYAISLVGDTVIIDDTYNANPDSMAMGLRSVADSFDPHTMMFVLGDMLELGSDSSRYHKEIGALCSELAPKVLVVVGKEAHYYGEGAEKLGYAAEKIVYCKSWEELVEKYSDLPKCEGIFAKGSRAIQLDKFIDFLLEKRP